MSRSSAKPHEIRRMWEGGPLRQFSADRVGSWTPLDTGGYGGQYICDTCKNPVSGIYEAVDGNGWQCSDCKGVAAKAAPKVKKPIPAS